MKTNVSDFFHSNTALSKEFIVLLFVLKLSDQLNSHRWSLFYVENMAERHLKLNNMVLKLRPYGGSHRSCEGRKLYIKIVFEKCLSKLNGYV